MSHQNQTRSGGKHKKYGGWRDSCCWIFNKLGRCTRTNCCFDNRCLYCGGYNHALVNCHKAKAAKKSLGKQSGHQPTNSGNENQNRT